MSRKTGEAWVETPKGYATFCEEVGELLTVFWHERRQGRNVERGWKFVCSGAWSQYVYPTVFAAIDAAEREWLDEPRDRSDVRDVKPADRRGHQSNWIDEAQRYQRRKERGEEAQRAQHQGSPFDRGQQTHEEAAQRAQQTHYERTFGDAWGRHQRPEAPRPAPPQQAYRPQWAIALELTGNGPWSTADVKAQYRKLAMQYHPDRAGGDVTKMAAVNAAYETAMTLVGRS